MANTAQDQIGVHYLSIPFGVETGVTTAVDVSVVSPFDAYIQSAHVLFTTAQTGHATNHRIPTLYTGPNGLDGSTADTTVNEVVKRPISITSLAANTAFDLFGSGHTETTTGTPRFVRGGDTISMTLAASGSGQILRSGCAIIGITGYADLPE